MKCKSPTNSQTKLFQGLEKLLNPEDSLYKLSWKTLEKEFTPFHIFQKIHFINYHGKH